MRNTITTLVLAICLVPACDSKEAEEKADAKAEEKSDAKAEEKAEEKPAEKAEDAKVVEVPATDETGKADEKAAEKK